MPLHHDDSFRKKFVTVACIGDVIMIHHVISCNPSSWCNHMTFLIYYMRLHALHIQLQSDYNIHYIIYYTNHYMELYMQLEFTCISHRIKWKTSKTLHVVLHDIIWILHVKLHYFACVDFCVTVTCTITWPLHLLLHVNYMIFLPMQLHAFYMVLHVSEWIAWVLHINLHAWLHIPLHSSLQYIIYITW